jgi:hypothetical protein
MIVSTLSFLQVQWTRLVAALKRCRRNYVTPLALQGGRNMVLLRAGGWVDALPQIPEDSIVCRYLAEEKHIVCSGNNGRLIRFPWLSVVDDTHDMTDFFTDLRITADHDIFHEDVMSLYAHQCQRFPVAPVQIITRDGDEIELDADFQEIGPADISGSTVNSDAEIEDDVEALPDIEDVSGDIILPGVSDHPVFPDLNYIK